MTYEFYFKYFPTGTGTVCYVTKCKGESFMTPYNVMIFLLISFVDVVCLQ
jgi:hypothetical protein